jgi:hypothetical protein
MTTILGFGAVEVAFVLAVVAIVLMMVGSILVAMRR